LVVVCVELGLLTGLLDGVDVVDADADADAEPEPEPDAGGFTRVIVG
jgi:hypothetical protein